MNRALKSRLSAALALEPFSLEPYLWSPFSGALSLEPLLWSPRSPCSGALSLEPLLWSPFSGALSLEPYLWSPISGALSLEPLLWSPFSGALSLEPLLWSPFSISGALALEPTDLKKKDISAGALSLEHLSLEPSEPNEIQHPISDSVHFRCMSSAYFQEGQSDSW